MKYYARQISPSHQMPHIFSIDNHSNWIWEDEAFSCIAIITNKRHIGYMPDPIRSVFNTLENGELADDIDSISRGIDSYYTTTEEAITASLPPQRENNAPYSEQEITQLESLVSEYGYKPSADLEILCSVLSIVYGTEYKSGEIHGCCQGDWATVIYPVSEMDDDGISIFECEYFNTGTEWIVHDEETDPQTPHDISGYVIYCHSYDDDEIRSEIANSIGCDPSDLVMWKFKGYIQTADYGMI